MLVLSRESSQSVVIGEGENQVVVTVVEVRGDRVRLGFEGNTQIPIHRLEVWEAIHRENNQSEPKGE